MVEMVGVVHVARPEFWRYANQLLADRSKQGWDIHYESVGPLTQESRQTLSPLELRLFECFSVMVHEGHDILGSPRLVHQKDAMRLPPNAINTDVDYATFIKTFAASLGKDLEMTIDAIEKTMPVFRKIPPFIMKTGSIVAMSAGALRPKDKALNQAVLDDRNNVALRALEAAGGKHTVMVWGAAHLPGMSLDLHAKGFRLLSSKWVTTFTLKEAFAR